MCSHFPNRGEQMVRYYGCYSNACRGKRRQENHNDSIIQCIVEAVPASPAKRWSWARLIQKIYEVDPLICAQCKAAMKISSFIEQPEVVKQILQHLNLWEAQKRPPPRLNLPLLEYCAAEQFPSYDCTDPDKPMYKKIHHG